uniref:Uncharacterized protein n=1 Tax=Timema bartmani TaxID=61472 RepID=A0A7R9F7W7_9NEOP|nr:unnamed protein product [Timema bartmani]
MRPSKWVQGPLTAPSLADTRGKRKRKHMEESQRKVAVVSSGKGWSGGWIITGRAVHTALWETGVRSCVPTEELRTLYSPISVGRARFENKTLFLCLQDVRKFIALTVAPIDGLFEPKVVKLDTICVECTRVSLIVRYLSTLSDLLALCNISPNTVLGESRGLRCACNYRHEADIGQCGARELLSGRTRYVALFIQYCVRELAVMGIPGRTSQMKTHQTKTTMMSPLINPPCSSGFGGSTVDIIILVIGSAVIVLFMVGMCYTCYKMRNRQRQTDRDNARTRFRSTVAVIQVSRSPPVLERVPNPSAPPVEPVRGVPPPYSPPPGRTITHVSRRTTSTIHGGRRITKMAASESTEAQSATKEMTSFPTDKTYLAVAPPRHLEKKRRTEDHTIFHQKCVN